jgi:hypothetical protein
VSREQTGAAIAVKQATNGLQSSSAKHAVVQRCAPSRSGLQNPSSSPAAPQSASEEQGFLKSLRAGQVAVRRVQMLVVVPEREEREREAT